ncbi:MAG: thiol reductant ABC exporter subunit CydC, partial [Streptosporangiales bacterium]
ATTELLHGMPDLVAAGAAGAALDRVARADDRLRSAEGRSARSAGAGTAAVVALCGLACCAALALGIDAVRDGRLAGVNLAVIALVPLALADVLGAVPDAVQHGLRARASLRRVSELVRQPDTVPDPASSVPVPAGPYGLRVEGLRARWTVDGPYVLDGVDLALPPGRRVAVVGQSGSGKSTLAAVLLRQLAPEGGRVLLADTDAAALAADDVRRVVGLCAQQAYVFDSTVAENVRLARPDASDEEVTAALGAARLGDWLDHLPHGLETRVGEHGNRLSGGERQRLALARVLLAGLPVVVLDEPTEHLDEPTADVLMADLLAATRDRAVLLLTHRTADLAAMDQVWRLDRGRLVPVFDPR